MVAKKRGLNELKNDDKETEKWTNNKSDSNIYKENDSKRLKPNNYKFG